MYTLVRPNISHKDEYLGMISEFLSNDNKIAPGAMGLKEGETYETFLKREKDASNGIGLSPGRVPGTLYFLINKGTGRLLGGIDIRHYLNDELKIISGHIGYGIRPSERKKGYATMVLKLAVPIARSMGIQDIMLTCDKVNVGSAKTIQNNGGILDSEYIHEGILVQKWRIK